MIETHKIVRWPFALLVIASVLACTAPPQKPPAPKPITSQARGLDGAPAALPDTTTSNSPGGPGAPGKGEGYGAASAHAAEVEEEEVAADGTIRLISSSHRAAQGEAAGQRVGAGGAPLPPSSASARHGGGGSRASEAATAYRPSPDMQGVNIDEPESVPRPAGDDPTAPPSSGATSGRPDALSNAHLGVRGGRDESGATSGTPPASSLPPQTVGEMPERENDILAQQLREAAAQEKDPVLRDKLWAEYRKYKAGL